MANPILRRIIKFLLFIAVLAVIFVAIALFFAFGGDNPALIQIGNLIDILVMGMSFVFVVAIIYKIMLMLGFGAETGTKAKLGVRSSQEAVTSSVDDEFPDLNQLVDNLESAESSKR